MKLKVGDKAKILRRNHGHKFPLGIIIEIKAVTSYNYICTDGVKEWHLEDDELEFISSASIFDGLIEGNYYRYQYDGHKDCLAICEKSNTHNVKNYIDVFNTYFKGNGNFSAASSVHPATPEEIEHLNACIAAGKYVDKPEKWIPKVGDWVTLIKSDENWAEKMNLLVGKTVLITNINTSSCSSIEFKERASNGSWSWTLENRHYRKALPHEIPQEENKTSHNLTPNKNEHTEIKSLSIREEHISISGIERPGIKSIRSEGSKVEITKYDRQTGIRSITG